MFMKDRLNETYLNKGEIEKLIASKIKANELFKDKDFEKEIRKIAANSLEKFFRAIYYKSSFWKNEV